MTLKPGRREPTARQAQQTLRAAIYIRVSTDEQAEEGTSLEEQDRVCTAYAESHGWQIVGRFPEDGFTGTVRNRPQLDRMMALADAGAFDVVIVMKLNRLARRTWVATSITRDLEGAGVMLASVKEQIDTTTPSGRLMRNVLFNFAEFDRDNIIEQTTSGLYARARKGSWPGGPPPWGLMLDGHTYKERQRIKAETRKAPAATAHKLDLDPDEVHIIRQATELLVDHGLTTWEAAKALNGMGLRPRDADGWTHLNLRQRLLDGHYFSGVYTWGGSKDRDPVAFEVPAILTPERHAALNAVLRSTSTNRTPSDSQHPYVLSRGILLGACGKPMHGIRRNDGRAPSYRCRGRQPEQTTKCDCRNVSVEWAERIVWSAVTDLLSQPERLVELADEYLGVTADEHDGELERIARYDHKITNLEVAKTRAATEGFKAGLDADEIRAVTMELDAELAQLRGHRDRLATWAAEKQEAVDRVSRLQRMAERLPVRLASMTPHERRQVLELLEVKVTVQRWDRCGHCGGRGKLRGLAKGKGSLSGGTTCPECIGYRQVPRLRIEGSVVDSLLDFGDDGGAGNMSGVGPQHLATDVPHLGGLSWPFAVVVPTSEAAA